MNLLQWKLHTWLLLLASALSAGFIVWLLIGLSQFEGHKSKMAAKKAAEEPAKVEPDRVEPEPVAGVAAVTPEAATKANLRRMLIQLGRTPQPSLRKKIFDSARARALEFESPLLDILADDEDPHLTGAVELAGELALPTTGLPLGVLAGASRPDVCAAAILAREKVEPWGDHDLKKLLVRKHPDVLVAALSVVAKREDRPVPELIALLEYPHARVRTAAAAAFPRLAPGAALDALCDYARMAEGRKAEAAAQALGFTTVQGPAEACLFDLLTRENRLVRRAALLALRMKKGQIENLEPLFRILADTKRRMHERVLGFWVMESTLTIPVARIQAMVTPDLNPMLKLFAARCLITAGENAGVTALIDILDVVESDTVTFNEFNCATTEARMLLRELATEDLGTRSEPWRQWHRKLSSIPPHAWKRLPPTFW